MWKGKNKKANKKKVTRLFRDPSMKENNYGFVGICFEKDLFVLNTWLSMSPFIHTHGKKNKAKAKSLIDCLG